MTEEWSFLLASLPKATVFLIVFASGVFTFKWHKEKSDMAYIYDWFLGFAFWEIRKWHHLKEGELPSPGREYK